MITLISKEWKNFSSSTKSIIIRKLFKKQEFRLVVLLIVTIYRDIVLEFGLCVLFVHYLQSDYQTSRR